METLAHYRIISLLGKGGMGEVFLAEDTRLFRKVALKVLLPEVAQDTEKLARFVQEARAASALSHPNAAHIYEIGEANGRHFLAMEYIEGETLEKRLAGEPLPFAEILSIGAQVADALEAAHARGIVHRDIKPANLMIGARNHVKVLDFGLAKILPVAGTEIPGSSLLATQFLTSGGVVLGTVSYMSPEQALGRDVDHRTDLFSLGIVMYQMASGKLPFAGTSAQETLARILQSQPDALGRLNYELPEEFERIVRKCLEKDRDRRYQSAKELLVDLGNLERAPSGEKTRAATIRAVIVTMRSWRGTCCGRI
jgi:serine/threonine protein kinase